MARPRTIQEGEKINLYLPKRVKRFMFEQATMRDKSMSAVVVEWAISAGMSPFSTKPRRNQGKA